MRHLASFWLLTTCLLIAAATTLSTVAQDAPPPTGDETKQDDSQASPPVQVAPDRIEPVRQQDPNAPRRDVPRYEYLDEAFPFDAEQPLVGFWRGNVETHLGPVIMSVLVEEGEAGLKVTQTAAQIQRPHRVCRNVQVDGRKLSWEAPAEPTDQLGWVNFEGTVSDDGQWLEGKMVWPGLLESDGQMKLQRAMRPRDGKNKVAYGGTILIDEVPFKINLFLAQTPAGNWMGHIDILDQRVAAWPLIRVQREGDHIVAIMGSRSPATYDGHLTKDGELYAGEYTQVTEKSEFEFTRINEYVIPDFPEEEPKPEAAPARPDPAKTSREQMPTAPFPYTVENLFIPHPAGHVLGATVTLPEGEGPFPAAILISGTGPQDRDQDVYNHKHFLVLADHLTRNGIAVIRYDDRGIGQSTGSYFDGSIATFATDAKAVLEYAHRNVKGIDPNKIGFVGFDEGGLIAPMVANESPGVAFIVLLGAPGLKGMEMQIIQTREELRLANYEGEAVQPILDALREMLIKIEAGADGNDLLPSVVRYVEAQVDLRGSTPVSAVPALARRQMSRLTSPWMRHFVAYDPRPALKKLTMPVLALRGELDAQVAEENLEAIKTTMEEAGGDITTKTYPGLNHLFQPAKTGAVSEYMNISITFSPEVMDDIAAWIRETMQ